MKNSLNFASTLAFDLSILAVIVSVCAAVYWAATEKLELAIVAMLAAAAALAAGIVVKGLVRLFLAMHAELEKANEILAVHTTLLTSLANRER